MCQDANAARDEDNYNGDSDEDIYRMLLDDDDSMEFFIGTSTPHGRLGFIENYGVNN